MNRFLAAITLTALLATPTLSGEAPEWFVEPSSEAAPETWFHLINGNVTTAGLTADLEAVRGAGFAGFQLFHGRASKRPQWPGVADPIACLSPKWDGMIAHVGAEARRLGLRFTMQNCPGWAMSGGPWIDPDHAMRHLVSSSTQFAGGGQVTVDLPHPDEGGPAWRDYRDVAVLAFPTPEGSASDFLQVKLEGSSHPSLPWQGLLEGGLEKPMVVPTSQSEVWIEFESPSAEPLRAIELPPVELFARRLNFDPQASVRLEVITADGPVAILHRESPRGTWQDRQPEHPLVMAASDHPGRRYRLTFSALRDLGLNYLRFSTRAQVNGWRAQAGYALRSLDRTPPPQQTPAAFLKREAVVDVSRFVDESGRLDWRAPEGDWTVLRFGHVNTGVKNKPAPPEATGFECDKLSPRGAEQHFAGYIGRLTEPGGAIEGRLDGMLVDSWECYTQTWTADMEQAFADRRGYALRSWLPALAGWVVENHATSVRFLRDWRATISEMMVDNYFGRLAELARARGMRVSYETAVGDVAPGDILRYYAEADIPMCEFWRPNDPHWGGLEAKPIRPTVSAARLYGKPVIAAEAFTNIGITWNEHPGMVKQYADNAFAMGVNRLVFHTYTHNPSLDANPGTSFGGRIGTPFLRGQTWWPHMTEFTRYLTRCQEVLQRGTPVADVLWYLGDDLDHKPRQDAPAPAGHTFNYVNSDALARRLEVRDGRLTTPEGVAWRVLWLPQRVRLTEASVDRLIELVNAGAVVVGRPSPVRASLAGGAEADAHHAEKLARLWGDVDASAGDRRLGSGRVLWGESIDDTLAKLGIAPDVVGANSLRWIHRRLPGRDVYFLCTAAASGVDANLSFRSMGRPSLWDPLTGGVSPVAVYRRDGGRTVVPLRLPAGASRFLVFDDAEVDDGAVDEEAAADTHFVALHHDESAVLDATDATRVDRGSLPPTTGAVEEAVQGAQPPPVEPWAAPEAELLGADRLVAWSPGVCRLEKPGGAAAEVRVARPRRVALDGEWRLAFPTGWDAPPQVTLPRLQPWSELADPAARSFSGTAVYRTAFELPPLPEAYRAEIDLGRVDCLAEVEVNGSKAGVAWAWPHRLDVTDQVREGANELVIRVTNTWHNRLIYDAGRPQAQRKTWAIHAPRKDQQPVPAGLTGPVVVRVGEVKSIR